MGMSFPRAPRHLQLRRPQCHRRGPAPRHSRLSRRHRTPGERETRVRTRSGARTERDHGEADPHRDGRATLAKTWRAIDGDREVMAIPVRGAAALDHAELRPSTDEDPFATPARPAVPV